MSDKLYIVYCTSGLGNRLRPLAAAMAYCQITGRRLRVYWDNITPNGCLTPLERLFETPFESITLDEIAALGEDDRSLALFTEKGPGHNVQREAERFGRDQLLRLAQRTAPRQSQALRLDESADVVIVYDNDYLASVPREHCIAALRSLQPAAEVRTKVLAQAAELGLWAGPGQPWQPLKGVHARGTDFGVKQAVEQYGGLVRERLGGQRFFLSTEDSQLEQGLRAAFPGQVISRHDRLHLTLNQGKQVWGDPDSYTISAEHGLDALTDIYLLSCVDLAVFHPGSTFAEIARHLHGVLVPAANVARTPSPLAERRALAEARASFMQRARALVARGDAVHALDLDHGAPGPVPPEQCEPAFMYWETLGYRLPFTERLFMNSHASKPRLDWDANVFNQLARLPTDRMPMQVFRQLCPYPEAHSQVSRLRGHIAGRKVLVIGSESFWLELLCAQAGAAEVTTVEYRPIDWNGRPDVPTRLSTITWDDWLAELDAHVGRYDLVLSYSSIEHSGLGRYGDRLTPLGDLYTFSLMARALASHGLCAVAVPTGQDLTHFNAHRIYGEQRIRALEHVGGLRFIGVAGPDAGYLANDPAEHLRAGWTVQGLARLPLGQYRQPVLCFAPEGWSAERYAAAAVAAPRATQGPAAVTTAAEPVRETSAAPEAVEA
ncbi:DUF268 domain-containing protein [Aquabacterium sp. OR-4]|uniref:DUF268 domain-containing protein n=1 Tax=Aquabacterium sp. OR-4 TaxID=2978127 RepID=UPI0028C703D5|nr:DUF268 domain-containing protein [Aquabacterium sp. OR-4]MDT7836548.1 DUF268 domain-containing protein [Aquabacterium sp. OR-4]